MAVAILCIECTAPERAPQTENAPEEKSPKVASISQEAIVLEPNEANDKRPVLDGHLFGKFFGDRAEFFVIQDSNSKIHDSQVKTIILYYLDERHCQSKYVLSDNICNVLIARYGRFSITPLDQENKKLLENSPIVIKQDGKTSLNNIFTRVELAWKLADKTIRFRLDRNSVDEEFVYTEHIPEYEDVFRGIEKSSL